jgi:hypothetical protein
VGDEIIAKIAPSLVNRINLQHLKLDSCKLTLKGLSSLTFYLKSNVTLVELSLSGNDFSIPEQDD